MSFNDRLARCLAGMLLFVLVLTGSASAQQAYNGLGSTTHSATVTAYTTGQLFALNTTGNAVASPIIIRATSPGQYLVDKAFIFSSGTNQPSTITLWLFSGPPFTTALIDHSAYIGPYAVDINSGLYLGSLSCGATWNKTNDGTAQYFSECSGSNLMISIQPVPSLAKTTTIYALEEETGTGYTPISSEKHSYFVSTITGN
jgi:hypothetical protein